ncbi:MAG TPA: PepSY domain-containing protein [Porticoccaceae bacterium]|nr:PepSY domain-containing protein [Gammaproteobacteria bacterium]HIL61279.1 PepSY domain-containing protein [Porticoccaceae bacterium]
MKLKKILFVFHRWLGIGMCLLFALWFASGIIMMYMEYPEFTEEERLKNLTALNSSQILLSPFEASKSIAIESAYTSVKLTTILNRPSYQLQAIDGMIYSVFADTGEAITEVTPKLAIMAVTQSGFVGAGTIPTYDSQVNLDQWSISAALNQFRPLHRIDVNDTEGTTLYVSNKSGQIVLDTNRLERFWNWLGSTIHWIYPVQLRKNAPLWNQVIIYVSIIGIISVITGGIIGLMQMHIRNPYKWRNMSPYRGWMKWHHILGVVTLVFVLTFIFSGLMSVGPWGIFNSSVSPQLQINRYTGGSTLRLVDLPFPDFENIIEPAKEVEWHKIKNISYFSITKSYQHKEVRFPESADQIKPLSLLELISNAVPSLIPDAKLLSFELITNPDNYYYSRHNNYRPFPVYRAKFSDRESTWFHIDQETGEIVTRVTDASRRERWLFNGLHSLDFQFLIRNRPLWDVIVILLSIIGFGFSLTSIVIGWRRLVK